MEQNAGKGRSPRDLLRNALGFIASGFLLAQSSLTLNNSQLNITSSNANGRSIGAIQIVDNASNSSINNSNITVNLTGPGEALGLGVANIPSAIEMNGGSLTVSGNTAALTTGPNISFSGVACMLNGIVASC